MNTSGNSKQNGQQKNGTTNHGKKYNGKRTHIPVEGYKIEELRKKTITELIDIAENLNIENPNQLKRQDIMFEILKSQTTQGGYILFTGILEIMHDGYGFLRAVDENLSDSANDAYVSATQVRKFALRTGDIVTGQVRPPKDQERYYALLKIEAVNYLPAPPRSGKTELMKELAHGITHNHPEIELIVLLVDERPEEVTDMQRSVNGDVYSSTFDLAATNHVRVAELVIEKAKRRVEIGKDVVILLDSITRLARAYNTVTPSSGKVLSGGVDANALHKPKRFFGAARNIENGGSLTIISTALVDTGSRMDEVIFEEFKGTGNSEIILDRHISDRRIYPAIDIVKSGTRKEELLIDKNDLPRIWALRTAISQMEEIEALKFLYSKLLKTKSNEEFLSIMND